MDRPHEPTFEEELEAVQGGDTPIEMSAARAALRCRDFRVLWLGSVSSSIGTWMQNVVLGAFAYKLTGSPVFVGLVYFAQLGPAFVLSIVSGALADVMDRRTLILIAQVEQLVASVVLAAVALDDQPNKLVLLAAVLAIGIGGAMHAPAWSAFMPSIVPREQLGGAMSLNAAATNLARLLGPALGALLYHASNAPTVFAVNAASYLFAIAAVLAVRPRPQERVALDGRPLQRIVDGVSVARRDPLLRWILMTITLLSFFCLPFLGQFPTIAAQALDMDPKSGNYGILYATLGFGALVGALSTGTFLGRRDRVAVVRMSLLAMTVALAVLSVLSSAVLAFPVIAVLGFGYFATTTSLLTVLQERVTDDVRGRILALWQMGWAGIIPIGNLVAGPIAQWASIRWVLAYGAVAAAALMWWSGRQQLR